MATYDSILEEQRKKEQAAAQKIYEQRSASNTNMNNAYVADINKIVDQSTKNATDKIQNDIEKLPQQYQSAYDTNAIQQKINERQVAERMANLGLTDSGLNRTQQTAINIQRANADAALTQQKNAAINNLKEQIADVVASGELQKQQTAAESRYNLAQTNNTLYNNLMDNAESKAVSYANNWQEQQTAIEKERIQQQAAIEKAKIAAQGKTKNGSTETPFSDDSGSNYTKPTKEILQKALAIRIAKGDQAYKDYMKNFPTYDVEAVDDYVNTYSNANYWTVNNKGGINWFGGIDNNASVKDSYGNVYTMKELYNLLVSAGMDKSKAKQYVIDLQLSNGMSTSTK